VILARHPQSPPAGLDLLERGGRISMSGRPVFPSFRRPRLAQRPRARV